MEPTHLHTAQKNPQKTLGEPIAAIDLGTNTFHLLVIERPAAAGDDFQVLHKEKIAVVIGQGGISKGYINEAAQERMFDALKQFRKTLDKYQVLPENISITATSALRNASNKEEIVKKVLQDFQLGIQVISGEQEAEYIYYGVKTALFIGESPALIMDIGGGSVEFIIGSHQKIFWKKSFEIGAQRLLDMFMQHDPISQEDVKHLKDYVAEKLQSLTQAVATFRPQVLIGSSGTFDTLDEINLRRKKIDTLNYEKESAFSTQNFEEMYGDLLGKNRAQRLAIPGMIEMRVDMIVVASCLLHCVLSSYQLPQVRVSPYALKEGLISKQLGWV